MQDKTLLASIAGIAVFSAAALAGSPTLILDDFDADPNDDAGGPRLLATNVVDNPFGQVSNFEVDTALAIGSDVGAAVFNSGIGVQLESSIRWDNDGAGLSLDAGALGLVGFELDFAMIDQDFSYSISLGDGLGQSITASGVFAAGGSRTESISLGDFVGGAFDAGDVDSVEIVFNTDGGTASLDFLLTEFRAVVPTPGSAMMLAMGGLLCSRRKR